jgi:hypothetical protein
MDAVTFRPTNAELEAAVHEEYEAMRDLAHLNDDSAALEAQKRAARHRLMMARAEKRALTNDLMCL